MNFIIFRDFLKFFGIFLNLKLIYLIKINFINGAGDVAKSGAFDEIAIDDLGRG